MIGESTSLSMKEIQALVQCFQKPSSRVTFFSDACLELTDPCMKGLRVIHSKSLVGSPGRGRTRVSRGKVANWLMVPQIIGRIIGRANDPHIKAFQDPVRGQSIPSQLLVGLIPDRLRGLFIQRIGNPKIASQFEMGPMVEGVSESLWHR